MPTLTFMYGPCIPTTHTIFAGNFYCSCLCPLPQLYLSILDLFFFTFNISKHFLWLLHIVFYYRFTALHCFYYTYIYIRVYTYIAIANARTAGALASTVVIKFVSFSCRERVSVRCLRNNNCSEIVPPSGPKYSQILKPFHLWNITI